MFQTSLWFHWFLVNLSGSGNSDSLIQLPFFTSLLLGFDTETSSVRMKPLSMVLAQPTAGEGTHRPGSAQAGLSTTASVLLLFVGSLLPAPHSGPFPSSPGVQVLLWGDDLQCRVANQPHERGLCRHACTEDIWRQCPHALPHGAVLPLHASLARM